jgi:hypothetical protein
MLVAVVRNQGKAELKFRKKENWRVLQLCAFRS